MTALRLRQIFGRLTRLLSPGYSGCGRCGCAWRFVQEHVTNYRLALGCFPLCEWCWRRLTPQERLPYYQALWQRWDGKDGKEWADIQSAVLQGL